MKSTEERKAEREAIDAHRDLMVDEWWLTQAAEQARSDGYDGGHHGYPCNPAGYRTPEERTAYVDGWNAAQSTLPYRAEWL